MTSKRKRGNGRGPQRKEAEVRVAPPLCFCGRAMTLIANGSGGPYWRCSDAGCDGTVGVHPGTKRPLGTAADRRTRKARVRAHEALDMLWRGQHPRGQYRAAAYRMLAEKMGAQGEVHIGEMYADDCARVVAICTTMEPADLAGWLRRGGR